MGHVRGGFTELMQERRIEVVLSPSFFEGPSALLCSEATPEHCHRRLVLEYLQRTWLSDAIRAIHL